MGFPMSPSELSDAFDEMDRTQDGRVTFEEFEEWWNLGKDVEFRKRLSKELGLGGSDKEDIMSLGSGVIGG